MWKKYAADFDNMSDEDVERENADQQEALDAAESWLEASAAWLLAGKPRTK
jgi:hypothetical protein